jgi:hypothetical protein
MRKGHPTLDRIRPPRRVAAACPGVGADRLRTQSRLNTGASPQLSVPAAELIDTALKDMTEIADPCFASIHLTTSEMDELRAIPNSESELIHEPYCYLETEHDGPHWGDAVEARSGEVWWLQWDKSTRQVVSAPYCDAEDGNPDLVQMEICTLHTGHTGRHGFHISRRTSPQPPKQIWLTNEQSECFR